MDIQTIKQKILPILKKYRVVQAGIFGSVTQGELTDRSDVDVLVELPDNVHGFDYVALKVDLQADLVGSLGRDVDLVEYNLIKPELKAHILPTQIRIL